MCAMMMTRQALRGQYSGNFQNNNMSSSDDKILYIYYLRVCRRRVM